MVKHELELLCYKVLRTIKGLSIAVLQVHPNEGPAGKLRKKQTILVKHEFESLCYIYTVLRKIKGIGVAVLQPVQPVDSPAQKLKHEPETF